MSEIKIFLDILDDNRRTILPSFKHFGDRFYLAGGTALALQLGHRDSVDFDFFNPNPFSTEKLWQEIGKSFGSTALTKIQEEENTLSVTINGVKASFFHFPYPLVGSAVSYEFFDLASVADIGCMKLSAITGRSLAKDYVDIYFILQQVGLPELLDLAQKKFPTLDTNLILKSLVYFDDITEEPIIFKHDHQVDLSAVSAFLQERVKEYQHGR
ncbi:MAG: nucleotidyl transferase AbiEii/AbiGii toxin family protein [Candidatus Berkelbacteria bacterium]|nr:nucleotidyl transferase AbiEii/AbiGii toxin family protein [Candidatus Berkelbacteria bacterium]MCR4307359.1 nucleotidyl transferase AbiEii/AbiGii toxin family protein [Candidatus Berkelbacteria bacterium]